MTSAAQLREGAVFSTERTITAADIAACAELTGDLGAHHVSGLSGRQVAQGLLTVATAPLLRNDHDLRLRTMRLTFLALVFAGDTITARVEVIGRHLGADGATEVALRLVITNQDGAEVLTGEGAGGVHSHPPGH